MHSQVIDNYSQVESPLHRLPAAVKMGFFVGVVVVLVTLKPTVMLFAIVAAVLIFISIVSKIPGRFILRRMLFLEPFVIGVAVLMLFQPHGVRIFQVAVVRTTLCILAIVLLANSTPFSEMLVILKRLRVPSLIVTTLALMHRYLFVLRDEADRMRSARAARTFTNTRRFEWTGLATVIAQLFVRSTARAERIYAAMCSRGWE